MAYTPKTLSDMKQSLADRHDNGTVPTDSTILAKYVRLLNRGVEYCADELKYTKETTVVVTNGVGDLPDDFIEPKNIFDSSNNEYFQIGQEKVAYRIGLRYWISGNQTDGFVLNTPNDDTFTVQYAFRPAPLVDNTDICLIPDIEAPVAYAYAMLRKGESDPFEDAELSLQECDDRIAKMSSTNSSNNEVSGFEIY